MGSASARRGKARECRTLSLEASKLARPGRAKWKLLFAQQPEHHLSNSQSLKSARIDVTMPHCANPVPNPPNRRVDAHRDEFGVSTSTRSTGRRRVVRSSRCARRRSSAGASTRRRGTREEGARASAARRLDAGDVHTGNILIALLLCGAAADKKYKEEPPKPRRRAGVR